MYSLPLTPKRTPGRTLSAVQPSDKVLFTLESPPKTPLHRILPDVDKEQLLLPPRKKKRISSIDKHYDHPDFSWPCNQTGDDHPTNRLSFDTLAEVAPLIAQILQKFDSDYSDTVVQSQTEVRLATQLLKRDVDFYRIQIQRATLWTCSGDLVRRNAILRALILFNISDGFAIQYLNHNGEERAQWITQLNQSASWIKPDWERNVGDDLKTLLERNASVIRVKCDPGLLWHVVYNHYFLRLFARKSYSNIREELAEARQYKHTVGRALGGGESSSCSIVR